MATGLKALPFSFGAHFLALIAAIMVLVWCIHFRGGLAWEAENKNLIFNIHPVLMLIGFIILGGEEPMSKAISWRVGKLAECSFTRGSANESQPFVFPQIMSAICLDSHTALTAKWIYGFVVFFYPGGSSEIRRHSLPWHVLFGMFVYVAAVANACLGFLEKLTFLEVNGLEKYGSEAFLVNFTAIATVLYGVFVFLTILSEAPTSDDHSYTAIS
ncbi:Transmembrane ascorbate ferrireductase 1 [Capsicum annuum]|nr:Transmembrane ascorbate ferrireductase 1 [Capsicum annuum]